MSELKAIVLAASQLRALGRPFLSATVVRVQGSGYRRPGARMLASDERQVAGSISGGCLERDVLARGMWRTREQPAVLVRYSEGEDALDERSGSGCQGVIDVLIQRHDPAADDVFLLMQRCLREERCAAHATVVRSDNPARPIGARASCVAGELSGDFQLPELALVLEEGRPAHFAAYGGSELLVEVIQPPPHLFVFGSGHDAEPLIGVSQQLGWSTSVWDAQPRISARERLREADRYLSGSLASAIAELDACVRPVAVVMGHHLEQDRRVLEALVRSRASYIGVLGPRRRTEQMLADSGLAPDPRLYAPVGLQLGAETPAEIALAIAAEIQATLTRSDARALRSDPGAIHRVP
ncbi:MAG TPA: XdhC family protein [Polyangiales bacterium]|nr:XdhC family protein [Polyangiales bacterium]